MVKPEISTVEEANELLRLAWAIATGRIWKPYRSALRELLDIRDALRESGYWWQSQRVEKAFHYMIKVRKSRK